MKSPGLALALVASLLPATQPVKNLKSSWLGERLKRSATRARSSVVSFRLLILRILPST